MGATTSEGHGLGEAGDKVLPKSNVSNVLFSSSDNDGDTINSNVEAVFCTFDDDYTLILPLASTMVGRSVYFRSRGTNGHTVTINDIYGSPYNFSSSYVHMTIISDGNEWQIRDWYTDD